MKKLILISTVLAFAIASGCTKIIIVPKKDSGKHKGWFKNRHNPHHPASDNPGHNKKKNPGKGKKLYEVHYWYE